MQHMDDTQTASNSRWYETLRMKRTKRRASPAGERRVVDTAPASLTGQNPRHKSLASAATLAASASLEGQNTEAQFAGKSGNIGRPSFPWGTKPQGPKKSLYGGTKPWEQKRSFPWGTKPQGQQQQTTPNIQGCGQKENKKTKMTPNHQG